MRLVSCDQLREVRETILKRTFHDTQLTSAVRRVRMYFPEVSHQTLQCDPILEQPVHRFQ